MSDSSSLLESDAFCILKYLKRFNQIITQAPSILSNSILVFDKIHIQNYKVKPINIEFLYIQLNSFVIKSPLFIIFSANTFFIPMDSDRSDNSDNDNQQMEIDLVPLQHKYQKVLTLNTQVRQQVQDLTRKAIRKPVLNGHIDPRNQGRPFVLNLMRDNARFEHFMTKKKNQSKKKQAFQVMRQMLEEKGYENIATLNQREHRAVMVVRFVSKVQNQLNIMQIEDDVSKEREKIVVRQGIAYVGLICAIEAVYENQMYRLEKIIDLSPVPNTRTVQGKINHPPMVFRALFTKGPFWKNDSKDNIGIQLIVNELQMLRYKENMRIDLLVVMGPLLSQYNQNVQNFTLERTFEEEVDDIIETLRNKCEKIIPGIEILVIPSTDDAISLHPIPQPPYDLKSKSIAKFASNPATVRLESNKTECKLNIINYDLINYIDESKCGRATKQPLLQNIETYLKQPFLITSSLEDAQVDETNFSELFNKGEFGNVIVMSSQRHPVFAHKVKGNKVFVNIGSLGIDFHAQEQHFMTLLSLYDGQGQVADRIRVDAIVM